jgi:hypothetical protein
VNNDEATAAVVDGLETLRIPYMVVGSFASNFYGVPRATGDADIVVQLEAGEFSALLKRLGMLFRLNPKMTFETVRATRRYVLTSADESFAIDLFLLTDDTHDQQRFARRRRVRVLNHDTFIPTVEDANITRLRWFLTGNRAKDLQDARGMAAVQGDRIDWEYVTSWCARHGTRELLESVRILPPGG